MAGLSMPFYYQAQTVYESYNPEVRRLRFGLIRFRSPLLTEYSLFLELLRCFSSLGSRCYPIYSGNSTRV